ncbi:MAG: PC4/YdbC family ssDNA-binding protein [Erysipelotrichaceae bacterium]|jgi:hypothetical protein|uniref:PC4/YdbC family ssDNA-binding protein n=1 Tax=Grylomicrobium aquisgranensis TaxID=2926318 RepID=A0AB35U4Z5_9FIRM|nr:PC4/YdbC family ssDNA-binding protein [Lactimicrobium massiliense]MCH4019534.1 PC4/YdbC family ssDNA-binding protein [Erysipelotrichaceae bacterium]MCI1327297.1 PC4/YdbC family ssDNA-binding protein [Solobacterium sp.]MDX8419452.1 PC4/YdbC family ssDNA-binding protein [Stecheria sp. CLA-KB-P133]MCH4045470.1 PC4/YdbC family ssDNA-binding protein [Erysipelotrichaceae bacterium]MCH4122680.1 PC4/YdbC family ssDNA-binding protein [Erysipelotrichaceae bacterium]
MADSEFHYDIEQSFGTVSKKEARTGSVYTKELNLISYNDGEPVYDLRNWSKMSDGTRRMGKGITFTLDELKELKNLLNDMQDLED